MKLAAPKARIILDYKLYFGVEPPVDRFSLIKDVSKKSILYELAALNHRLKPKKRFGIDTSFESQLRELKYFTKTPMLFAKYSKVAEKFTRSKEEYPLIFTRQACLFAIEEILNSEGMQTGEEYDLSRIEQWEPIVKYLLAVNYAITLIKEVEDDDYTNFESLNSKILPLNELSIGTDPIFTLYRGYWLVDYFLKQPDFKNEMIIYFHETYGIEPHNFIFHLMEIYMTDVSDKSDWNFFYYMKEDDEQIFDKLSVLIPNNETHKLISIRKSPFINVGKRQYLIADNSFLLEKAYSQLLNDFWFDKIKHVKNDKGKAKFDIRRYRSEFGYFFEQYLSQILLKCFENYQYTTLLMFDQLKINTPKGVIEIADVYFRYNKRILIGQVKSNSIYDEEKFGGSVESLYKNDRSKSFKDFGVDQVLESILKMDTYMKSFDDKFPKGHTYQVFPCIFVNDKALQTPLMADTFNTRFQELIKDLSITIKKVRIEPLTLIHINDIERLEDTLNKNPKAIWKLLQDNHQDKKFIPPFYNTLNFNQIGISIPARIRELLKFLISMYRPDNIKNTSF